MYAYEYAYTYTDRYVYMVPDNTKQIWEAIDEIVELEKQIETYFSKLQQFGFPKREVNDIIECFVVDKLKKLMEEK